MSDLPCKECKEEKGISKHYLRCIFCYTTITKVELMELKRQCK
jgi:hypothetical protein